VTVQFACRVGGVDGSISERAIVAESADNAREILAEEGFEVFAVRRQGGVRQWLGELRRSLGTDGSFPRTTGAEADVTPGQRAGAAGRKLFARRHVATADLLLITEELAALFRAGLPLLKCVDILRQRRSGSAVGDVLDRVRDLVAGGESLSGAFDQEDPGSGIPRLFVTSVAIGETSGDLEGALRRYAQHLERAQTLRRRVRGALIYPAALFGVSMGVIGVLIGFVLPRFANFYASYEAELPLLTRILMSVGLLAKGNGRFILVALVGAVVGLVVASRSTAGRQLRERWELRMPLFGRLRQLYLDVEATRTMATLLHGGAPLTEALAVAADGTDHTTYRARLRQVGELVSQGNSLHKSLEINDLMDPMGLEMVEVGEYTGSLEEMLGHVAASYDEVLERRLNTAVALLEPAVLVTMGLFLAAVLLSLYIPLFNVVQVVG